MADSIRRIKEESDFHEVSALFNYHKSVILLKWLFTDPNNPSIYNAFVAVSSEDKIIGVIGYVSSFYKLDMKDVLGVIPMSWKVSPDHKGMAGVLLMKEALKQGEFGFIYGGTKIARNIYPIFKFLQRSNIDYYFKILNLKSFLYSLKGSTLKRKIGMPGILLPSYFHYISKKLLYDDLNLVPYDGKNFVKEKEYNMIFNKKITKNYIEWLLNCPTLESYAFSIKKDNDYLGICVLYIQNYKNYSLGRVVHLPFLGFDKKLWISVIQKCIIFFKKKDCCVVSGLAHHDMNHLGFKKSGFIRINHLQNPLYLKDVKHNLASININNWYLQYSEGDQAYRNFM